MVAANHAAGFIRAIDTMWFPARGSPSLARATLLGWGPPRVGGLEFKGLREK